MMTARRMFANSEDDQGEQFNCNYAAIKLVIATRSEN